GVRPSAATHGTDFIGNLPGIFLRARHANDIGSFLRKFQSDGATDAATGASHHGDLIGELAHDERQLSGVSSPLSMRETGDVSASRKIAGAVVLVLVLIFPATPGRRA